MEAFFKYWPLLAFGLNLMVALIVYSWKRSLKAEFSDFVEPMRLSLAAHDRKLVQLEERLGAVPTDNDLASVRKDVAVLNAQQHALDAKITGVSKQVDGAVSGIHRIETFLLKQVN